jgi:hypothetical protein
MSNPVFERLGDHEPTTFEEAHAVLGSIREEKG